MDLFTLLYYVLYISKCRYHHQFVTQENGLPEVKQHFQNYMSLCKSDCLILECLPRLGMYSLSAWWKYSFIQRFTKCILSTYYVLGPACCWGLTGESHGLWHPVEGNLPPSRQYYPWLSFWSKVPQKTWHSSADCTFGSLHPLSLPCPTFGKGP